MGDDILMNINRHRMWITEFYVDNHWCATAGIYRCSKKDMDKKIKSLTRIWNLPYRYRPVGGVIR